MNFGDFIINIKVSWDVCCKWWEIDIKNDILGMNGLVVTHGSNDSNKVVRYDEIIRFYCFENVLHGYCVVARIEWLTFGRRRSAWEWTDTFRANTLRTIRSSPMTFANASSCFQIISATLWTSWQTLINLLIHHAAVVSLPSSLAWNRQSETPLRNCAHKNHLTKTYNSTAHWYTCHAQSKLDPCSRLKEMEKRFASSNFKLRKERERERELSKSKLTLWTIVPFVATFAMAFTFDTTSMSRASGHLTFARWDFTFWSFVAFLTMAHTAAIMSMPGTQHRTHT